MGENTEIVASEADDDLSEPRMKANIPTTIIPIGQRCTCSILKPPL